MWQTDENRFNHLSFFCRSFEVLTRLCRYYHMKSQPVYPSFGILMWIIFQVNQFSGITAIWLPCRVKRISLKNRKLIIVVVAIVFFDGQKRVELLFSPFYFCQGAIKKLISCGPENLMKISLQKCLSNADVWLIQTDICFFGDECYLSCESCAL